MQQMIDDQVKQFEAINDAMRGEAGEELVKPKWHVRAGFTTNKGRGTSKAKRKMAAASRRRNRAA
jgi:hypothetical protein